MAKTSPDELYRLLLSVGFTPQGATTMVAIAGAESDYKSDAVGDVALENSTWGPSFGFWQIRTLKAKTGSNTTRDISWLTSPTNQAKAAYEISNGGRDFTPWSTYTSGAFRQFLGGASSNTTGASLPDSNANTNADESDSSGVKGWKAVVLESLFVLAALGLTVYGVKRSIRKG